MNRYVVFVAISVGLAHAPIRTQSSGSAHGVTATRLTENPLVTVDTSASLVNNVNGPTVIRVPDWIDHPLGRYYVYFANHFGHFHPIGVRGRFRELPRPALRIYLRP
jgi:hypothetical protein